MELPLVPSIRTDLLFVFSCRSCVESFFCGRLPSGFRLFWSFAFANSHWLPPVTAGKGRKPYRAEMTSGFRRAHGYSFAKPAFLSRERTSFKDFAADATPVPLAFMVAAGAGQVHQDAAETELGELSLHSILSLRSFSSFPSHTEGKTGGPYRRGKANLGQMSLLVRLAPDDLAASWRGRVEVGRKPANLSHPGCKVWPLILLYTAKALWKKTRADSALITALVSDI
jgi:hypothetical protein